MSFDIIKHKKELLFVPLGGSGEIGMNLNLYHYQGKWLMVDLGIGFASDRCPGVDVVVPNIDFIEKNKSNLVGLVLTHAHEDHLGAVPYLWQSLQCPIYTTKFTAAVLKAKFAESGVGKGAKIHELDFNSRFELSPFDIELCGMTHSIPEMNALMIRTPVGNILHTGDWKFDHDPLIGLTSDEVTLKKIADEGVLVMVGDSTNIFNEGSSGSEGDLSKSLEKIIGDINAGLIVVTTFASNIARVYSIAKAGQKLGRKVILAGRSLWRMYEAALQCGYMKDIDPLLADDNMRSFPRDKVLVICTGSQGEPLAAMNKAANDTHPAIKISKGDTVIFASKIIPGNDKKIYALMNQLCRKGAEVMTERDHFVHVSGHPARDEVAKLYKILRPKMSIPVHGEAMHIHEHAKFARECGVKHAIEVTDGDVIRITENNLEKIGMVNAGYLAVDGNFIINPDANVLKIRRRMRDAGLVVITLILNKTGLARHPSVIAPGLLDGIEDKEFLLEIAEEIADFIVTNKKKTDDTIEKTVRSIAKRMIKKEVSKEPYIVVQLEKIA
jgi:ribonuclease J